MDRGDVWGKFEILRYLGSGAMGEVFLATNIATGMQVALKRVRRGAGTEGEEKIAAERSGAELERRLSRVDPRVTRVFQCHEIDGDLGIEMEYVEGEDLSSLIAHGPVAPGRAAVIAAELCEMLQHLRGFESGVIHGDLKPKNIRIISDQSGRDRIKIMDFGVAKALSDKRDHTASLFGSIAYCSPERLDTGRMDSQSDLWSVGVMVYQMIAGRLPFEGATPERLEWRIRDPRPPDPLPADCPEPLHRIVFQMLTRELARRYQSETEARDDLERFLKGQPVTAAVIPAFSEHTVRTAKEVDFTRRTAPMSRKSLGLAFKRLLLASGATLLFLALLAFWLIRPQYQAWADTRDLKHQIEAEHLDAGEAWKKYQEIVSRGRLGITTWGIGSPLKAKLLAEGDKPILDFRNNDYPTSREGNWKRSLTYFSQALELDPGDRTVRGKLRLSQAHLQRITAAGTPRQQMLNQSAEQFHEAAELLHKSPDPYLGLERLYAYNDPDRARMAMDTARQFGHTPNRRELNQVADGYFRRAVQAARDSQKFKGLPQNERDYLFRSRQDYEHARTLYEQAGSYGNAANNLLESIRGLDQVQNRLREMDIVNP